MKKIYWRDIQETGKVINYGGGYTCNGITVFWHQHEAAAAQQWLDARAKHPPVASDVDAGELATLPGYDC